jgi:hypothetical protein
MARSVPSRRISTVVGEQTTGLPRARAGPDSASSRACSWTIWNTRSSGCPSASSGAHPVSCGGDGVERGDVAAPIRGDHAVADALQGHPQLLALRRVSDLRVGGVARAAHGAAERGDAETDGEVQREAAPALGVVDAEPVARLDQESRWTRRRR